MAGRRRQPADRSRHSCEDGDRGERRVPKERTGDLDKETPKKSGKKLSRTARTGAARSSLTAAASSSSSVPPGSERDEEPCPSKKTPKQFSRCQPWTSSFNSPSNDGDQQQDIFWDPHSPTTFKLENGKKRLAANRCTVDISDIVNRIAPKNEKPSNSDAAYLGFWIGENAIPCTPVVTRTRTKMPRSRILQTEEELLKLARQLDNNLVKQKDQSEEQAANSEDEMFSGGHAGNNEDGSYLEDLPDGDDIAQVLKSVSQTSAPPPRSSQKSVDQEAEAAFIALFDSSTQKYSGHLSQGFSDVSTSSLNDAAVNERSNVQEATGNNRPEPCSERLKQSEQCSLASEFLASTFQSARKCSEQNNDKEKEPAQTVSGSQDDFEDDWGNDLLEDDSFIMQVTQNPELIATPKNSMASNKTSALHSGGEVKSTVIPSTSSKINNFKFVPRKGNSGSDVRANILCSTESTSSHISRGNSRDANNAKSFSSTQTRAPPKSQTNVGQNTKNNVHNVVPATHSTLPKASQKPSAQTTPQTRATAVTKDSAARDEWDDLKFSDEVLDMFCESDSLWEEKEDDDLLYQVCDDVERLTQAQEVNGVNLKKESVQLPSSTCQSLAKSGNASQQNKHGSHVAASSFLGSNKRNNRGVSPSSFSGNCSNAYQNSSLQKSNQTFSRSNSVPSIMEGKTVIPTGAHTQNPAKSMEATCSAKDTLAPSKYSFTRVKASQVPSVHVAQLAAGNQSAYNGLHPQSFSDRRNGRDTMVQYNSGIISKPQQSLIKRHLSESTLQASKVFVSEDKNKKCSMEEIERKKQEALARRKARASFSDTAPT